MTRVSNSTSVAQAAPEFLIVLTLAYTVTSTGYYIKSIVVVTYVIPKLMLMTIRPSRSRSLLLFILIARLFRAGG
jgi:hypothetical protein